MKQFLLIISLILISISNSLSVNWQDRKMFNVGKEPSAVFVDNGGKFANPIVYIICSGYDMNFNDTLDVKDGDETPSIWALQLKYLSQYTEPNVFKVCDLPFGSIGRLGGPMRVGYTPVDADSSTFTSYLYLPQNGKISRYTLVNGKMTLKEDLLNFKADAVSVINNNLLLSVNSPSSRIFIYDMLNKIFLDSITTPKNVMQTYSNHIDYIFAVCEGNFGKNDGKLLFIDLNMKKDTSLNAGDTPNYLSTMQENDNEACLISNGSHEMRLIGKNIELVKLPTSGYSGPRECAYDGQSWLVTAYDGKVYSYDTTAKKFTTLDSLNEMLESIRVYAPLKGNPASWMFVTAALNMDYSPSNHLYVYDNGYQAVDEPSADIGINMFPNPTNNIINIKILESSNSKAYSVELLSYLGNSIKIMSNIYSSEISLNIEELASGIYFIKYTSTNKTVLLPIVKQ
ncbi:MAG: T9SS type A sorting domain-containing protein [Candidatus Kapabacteria bacterium]|nr:T9SS type A sorting domain-containing protein [Candidatus Kapabacteria bacterium]